MNRTVYVDKHEMVVDRADFEALETLIQKQKKTIAELLQACKYAKEIMERHCSIYVQNSVEGRFINQVILKAKA